MKPSLLGTVLWTLAAAVLANGIIGMVGSDGLCGWMVSLVENVVPSGAFEVRDDVLAYVLPHEDLARRFADALTLGLLFGAAPLLVGLRGQPVREAATELALSVALTTLAVVGLYLPLEIFAQMHAAPWAHIMLFTTLATVALATDGCAARLRTLVGVELLKLWRGKLLRVGLLVALAATLLAGLTHEAGPGESGWTRAAHALGVGFWTSEILVLVIGATMIAGEISQSTMKMILPHAYRRAEWVAAKSLVLVICAVAFALVVTLTGVLHTSLGPGLGDVTREAVAGFGAEEEIEVFQTSAVMWGHLLDMTWAATASLIASALVGLLLSCIFQSLVPALSASFLVFAALKTGDIFLGFSKGTLESIYAHAPDELRRLTENFGRALNESWNDEILPRGLALSLLTGVLCLLVSLRLFGRRDLQG